LGVAEAARPVMEDLGAMTGMEPATLHAMQGIQMKEIAGVGTPQDDHRSTA
jgi:hypothetical protein